MEVVTPNSTHTFTVYGRETQEDAVVIVYNEQNKDKQEVTVPTIYSEGRLTFNLVYDMEEGNNYFIIVNDPIESKELCKFKVFCTSATDLQRYALSDGKYTFAPDTSNTFKTAQ